MGERLVPNDGETQPSRWESVEALKASEFIGRFIEMPRDGQYVDLGRFDCGITDQSLFLRDKPAGTITELPRPKLQITRHTRTRRNYYLLVSALFLFVTIFVAFFMIKAIEFNRDRTEVYVVLGTFLGIMVSPFLARSITRGFRIIVLYFVLCAIFAVLIGRWERYASVEGFAVLLTLGVVPYLGSRLFVDTLKEAELEIGAADNVTKLTCSHRQAERLTRAIQMPPRRQNAGAG